MLTQGVAPHIQPLVQVIQEVDQPNGIDFEDGGFQKRGELGSVPGDGQDIPEPQRMRSQCVGLNAQHITIAGTVVEEDVDAHLLLQEGGERERAHAARYPRAVGNVDCVHSPCQEKLRAFHLLGGVAALGRNNLR